MSGDAKGRHVSEGQGGGHGMTAEEGVKGMLAGEGRVHHAAEADGGKGKSG